MKSRVRPLILTLLMVLVSVAHAGAPPANAARTRGQRARQVLRTMGRGVGMAAHVAAPFAAYFIGKHYFGGQFAGLTAVDPHGAATAALTGVASIISAVAFYGRNLPGTPPSQATSNFGVGYVIHDGHVDITYGYQQPFGVVQSLSHPGHIEMNSLQPNQVIELNGTDSAGQ